MIKIGDKIRVKDNISMYKNVETDGVYEVTRVDCYGLDIDDGETSNNYMLFSEIELFERKFTKQDLEVGMYVRYYSNHIHKVETKGDVVIILNSDNFDGIYKKDENGNLIIIWEREEEKLYTLELPNNENRRDRFYIEKNNSIDYYFGNYNQNKATVRKGDKCYFTQREIKNLPNQDFIKQLVKKEKMNDK